MTERNDVQVDDIKTVQGILRAFHVQDWKDATGVTRHQSIAANILRVLAAHSSDTGVWKPCRICFDYNANDVTEGAYRDNPDSSTTLRLTFPAGTKHPLFGKPMYHPISDRVKTEA